MVHAMARGGLGKIMDYPTGQTGHGSCHGKGHGFQQELEEWINMLVITTLFRCIVPFKGINKPYLILP